MGAVDVWLESEDDDLEECSECGHEHFDTRTKKYIPCVWVEGCECPFKAGE